MATLDVNQLITESLMQITEEPSVLYKNSTKKNGNDSDYVKNNPDGITDYIKSSALNAGYSARKKTIRNLGTNYDKTNSLK